MLVPTLVDYFGYPKFVFSPITIGCEHSVKILQVMQLPGTNQCKTGSFRKD